MTKQFIAQVKQHGKKQFKTLEEFKTKLEALNRIKSSAVIAPTNEYRIKHGSKIVHGIAATTCRNAIERPIGRNLAVLKQKLGQIHVGTPYVRLMRLLFSQVICDGKRLPRALRRGLIATTIEIHSENRRVYNQAMKANLRIW